MPGYHVQKPAADALQPVGSRRQFHPDESAGGVDQLALPLDAAPPDTYRQRGTSSLQRLFRTHFPELLARYEAEFAKRLGKFRLERITKAVERFLACGDYRRGIARIKCTNPQG
jgi:hypothetical protein